MSRHVNLLKRIAEYSNKTSRFERYLKEAQLLLLDDGRCRAEFLITKDHLNAEDNLHTGLIMTMVDVISSWALLSYKNGFSGVSANIHLSHIKPAISGEIISIDAKLCGMTETLAFLEVEMKEKNTNEIKARGEHTLFIKPVKFKS